MDKLKLPNEEEEYDNDEFNEGEEPNSKGEVKQRELFAIDSMTNGLTGSVGNSSPGTRNLNGNFAGRVS